MTEQTTEHNTDTNTAVVEKFLYALRDKDLDTAGALLDDNLVYENVGLPTIRGRHRTMKLFAGMQKPSVGFDVKFHRVAADGDTVLTERTDALIFGRVRLIVLGVRRVRSARRTDHIVAGLLRHVRYDQGPRARPGRRGGAGSRPEILESFDSWPTKPARNPTSGSTSSTATAAGCPHR